MSIALSVVVAPSRLLRLLAGSVGAGLCAAALLAGMAAAPRFAAAPAVVAALLFAGLCLAHAALRPATVHRIDISGPGRIRLTVQQDLRPDAAGGMPVVLLPASTLWPQLLLLRFGPMEEGGEAAARGRGSYFMAVLPDSVGPDAFRALAVALGAVAGQGAVAVMEREIL